MSKFSAVETLFHSVFASPGWLAEGIKTFPANFVATDAGSEFIRVSIVASGRGINLNSTSGIAIVDIFIPAGAGPKRASLIADRLDFFLVGKSFKSEKANAQFGNSSLDHKGLDKDNPTLHKSIYTVSFNLFGVSYGTH